MAFLYRVHADGSPAECWTLDDKPVVIGRSEFADAYVEDDALSGSHFLIVREGGGYLIVDLHSSNGTWVNGSRITAQKLHPNEFVMAGRSLFCFVEPAVSAYATPTAAFLSAAADAARERSQAA
jgi:pSer/pThr/pTyr-binding forkhead associated (FHA) protein